MIIMPSQIQTPKKNSVGKVIRKAAFFTLLATTTPALLNAQVQQIWFPKDSTGGNIKIAKLVYIEQKKEANQIPATIEFVGGFQISIFQNDIYKKLKINDDITLSISEQKLLFQKTFVENDKYVFFYTPPVDYGGVRVYLGGLNVFKKK